MLTPIDANDSGIIPFTVAAVPTGIKTGVSTFPQAVVRVPRRAIPSVALRIKPNSGVFSCMGRSTKWLEVYKEDGN